MSDAAWPSPAEALHRAATRGARLGAFVALADDRTQAVAGPLQDLPYAAKDMFDVAGRAPTCGLESAPGPVPSRTARVITRLDGAGAVRIGYTAMSALAYEPSGRNPLQASPVNPWNPDFMPGGSSSGSAVAVAGRIVPVALGSDTAGSLRIPAQCCGVFAWKPAHGRVPAAGAMPLSPSLDAIGLLAARAADLAAVAPVIGGVAPEGEVPRLVVLGDALEAAHPAVRRAVEDGLAALARLGLVSRTLRGLDLVEAAGSAALTILDAEAAVSHGTLVGNPLIGAQMTRRLRRAGEVTPERRAAADAARAKAEVTARGFWGEHALVVLPVMPICTPPLAEADPANPAFRPRTLYEMSAFTRFVNAFGWAAVAIPVGMDDRGLPVAMQVVAPPRMEGALLALARRLDESGHLARLEPPLPEETP